MAENQPDIPAGGTPPAPPPKPPPPSSGVFPAEAREDDRRIVAVEEIFRGLLKAIKSLNIYAHNPAAFENFVGPVYQNLTKYLKTEDRLALKVEAGAFRFMGAEVFRDSGETSLTYKFFRDGVRKFVFRDGITIEEMRRFITIASAGARGKDGGDDTVALLWKAELEHIEYVIVEGIAAVMGGDDGAEGQTAEVEIEKVADFVTSRLRTESDDVVRFARVCADDLNLEMSDVQSVRGVASLGEICPQEHRDAIQLELSEEDETLMMSKVLIILFALVRYGIDDTERNDISENLLFLLDSLLLREDWRSIASIIAKLDELNRDPQVGIEQKERILWLKYKFMEGLSSESRVDRLKAILTSGRIQDADSFAAYLACLNNEAYLKIPAIMEVIEIPENVRALAAVLARPHPQSLTAVSLLLQSTKLNVVIEGLKLVAKMEFQGKGSAIAKLLSHPSAAVRLEALRATASIKTDEAKTTISKSLDDADAEIRSVALEAALVYDHDWAGKTLARIMADPKFAARPVEEQQKVCAAAALTGAPPVLAQFGAVLQRKSGFFNKKEINGPKLQVIEALRREGSLIAFKALQGHCEQRYLDPEVKAACKKAMDEIKQKLVGG